MTDNGTGNNTSGPHDGGQYWPGWAPGYRYPSVQATPQPAPPPQPPARKKHRLLREAVPALVAAAVVVAAGAGVVVGHYAWPEAAQAAGAPITASPHGTHGGSGPNGNGPSGSNGFNGMVPFGMIPNRLLPNNQGNPGERGDHGQSESGSITSAPGAPASIATIAKKVDPAVVDIDVRFSYQRAAGAGTGIVLTKDGEVLTNNHVIDGATAIAVTDLGNGKTYGASVVGYDPGADVAVLQLKDAKNLTTAHLGDSHSVTTGEPVVGIGNAGGAGGTPSVAGGSVTALGQSTTVGDEMYGTSEHLQNLIETNADIRPGDSGGPLVTSSGAVIGMDTAASVGEASVTTGHEGLAIPIDTAEKIASAIESGNGSSSIHVGRTAALGVLVQSGNGSGNRFAQPGSRSSGRAGAGATVAGVIADGAAAHAGLKIGDVITSLDGHSISSAAQLTTLMTTYHPGDSVTLGWNDPDGEAHHDTVTLGTGPAA